MKKNRKYQMITLGIAVLLGVLSSVLSYQQVLKTTDQNITNWIYDQTLGSSSSKITIIAIDEETIEKYGEVVEWSRSLLADAVNKASDQGAAGIGLYLDLSNTNNEDQEGDAALVEACSNAADVVALASMSKPGETAYPYDSLKDAVTVGISDSQNQQQGPGNQNADLYVTQNSQDYDSFATAVYRQYLTENGEEYTKPNVDNQNQFGFQMMSTQNIISFTDFLEGNIDAEEIKDHVILIGEYPQEETQEEPNQGGQREVTIQASIIETLLNQDTLVEVSQLLQSLICGVLVMMLYLLVSRPKIWQTVSSCIIGGIVVIAIALVSNQMGYRILFLVPVLFAGLCLVISLFQRLFFSIHEKKKMEKTLKLYVDPHVADAITQKESRTPDKISTRRQIAVLFVDLRGFTTISESLQPEQVVEILNEYLSKVADAVSKYNGTLDKFIGDAAMAVFNAPFDLDDYEMISVLTALEIARQSEEIRVKFEEKYHKTVNFGIGINCGDAIVGNIGSDSHMDYTAIGDTVNVASRLEGIAGPNQILISEALYQRVQTRVRAEDMGMMQLKGKQERIRTYQVMGLE